MFMEIKNDILKYSLQEKGDFYYEEKKDDIEIEYHIYFSDDNNNMENLKVEEDDNNITIYTSSEHNFNNKLGFMSSICSTTDKECADMICEALNNLKKEYINSTT